MRCKLKRDQGLLTADQNLDLDLCWYQEASVYISSLIKIQILVSYKQSLITFQVFLTPKYLCAPHIQV